MRVSAIASLFALAMVFGVANAASAPEFDADSDAVEDADRTARFKPDKVKANVFVRRMRVDVQLTLAADPARRESR